MKKRYTINDIVYSKDDLVFHSKNIIASESPAWEKHVFRFILDWISEDETISLNTSGTTGKRKVLEVEKEKCIRSAEITANRFGLRPGMSCLLCLSVDYIAGKMMVIRALENHWNLILAQPSSNPLSDIRDTIDFTAMVPYQVQTILESSPEKLNQINTLLVGGAPVSNQLAEKLQATSCRIYETFGMTETLTHFAVRAVNSPFRSDWFQSLPEVSLGVDQRNCLIASADWFPKFLVRTNDVVEFKAPDRFQWLGRYDNVINTGGVKIYPEQVEQKLVSILGDSPFFVGSLPDKNFGQKVVLFIEGKGDEGLRYKEEVISVLEKIEQPKEIVIIEKFFRTSSGKINRKKSLTIRANQ
ncbi:MAG: AMP-binding protein [Candidatus Marinimicrobia bacterium]|nr:AMP-binding protein [Candidatus Neomarinimicrobiota bacterium]